MFFLFGVSRPPPWAGWLGQNHNVFQKSKLLFVHFFPTMIEAEDALSQSTRFKDRVFLSAKKERASVLQLVNGETDMLSFLSSEITSHNGSLLRSLVEYIEDNYSHLPEEYSRMIKNICKPYSVSSLIQVTSEEPLKILERFCKREVDLLSAENHQALAFIEQQMPPFWECLHKILMLEKSKFLPYQLGEVVLQLITIRENTFSSATIRSEDAEMERFTVYISLFSLYFLPPHPFPISKIATFCRKLLNIALLSQMSQKT